MGRVTSVSTPDNSVVSTSYSGNQVTVTDPAGKRRKSETDAFGRLVNVWEDPNGANYQTSYQYDVLDNLTTVTQGVQTRSFVYDSLSRLTSAANPESGTITYGYDNNGNLTSRLDARNITTTFVYDALNRITSKSYNDSPQTASSSYFYDSQSLPSGAPVYTRGYSTGRLVAATFGGGSSEGTYRGYDQLGRVVRKYQRTASVNYLVEASYFADSAIQSQTYPSVPGAADRRVISRTNDSAGRLATLSSSATSYASGATVSAVGYAPHNGLATETFGNGLIHAITYNARLQTSQIKLGASGTPTSVLSLVYNYGSTTNNGNVQSIAYNGGGLSYTQTFGYDALNRLTTSVENAGASWSQTNVYDRYGNRWIDLGGGNQNLFINTSNNRITGWSYDNAGNLLNDGFHSYAYDGENKISNVDGVSAYVYDADGQRVRKLFGDNLRFIYGISEELIAEFDGVTGNLKKEYIHGTNGLVATIEPTAVNPNGTRYIVSDSLGTPRVVTNTSAGVVSRHDYMPFGEEIGAAVGGRTVGMGFAAADGLRQQFTLKERDVETTLDYFGSRFYSPTQGRFTSADTVGGRMVNPQTLNLYTYVKNNPLRYIDPTGHYTQDPQDSGPKVDPKSLEALGDPPPPFTHMKVKVTVTEIGLYDDGNQAGLYTIDSPVVGGAIFGLLKVIVHGIVVMDDAQKRIDSVVNTPEGQITMAFLCQPEFAAGTLGTEVDAAMAGEADATLEMQLYRNGPLSDMNFTPRPVKDANGLSTFTELERATPPGGKAQVIDPSRLTNLKPELIDPGHYGIVPVDPSRMAEWISTRGTGVVHEFTIELKNAVTHEVKRPKP